MKEIFIIYEERESSPLCGIRGIFNSRNAALDKMKALIEHNPLYSEYSTVNFDKAFSESDPEYAENEYSNYTVLTYTLPGTREFRSLREGRTSSSKV